jgi:hypothetical protein
VSDAHTKLEIVFEVVIERTVQRTVLMKQTDVASVVLLARLIRLRCVAYHPMIGTTVKADRGWRGEADNQGAASRPLVLAAVCKN